MSKLLLTAFPLLLFLLFASPEASSTSSAARPQKPSANHGQSGTLQKMIVESGSVTMRLDVKRLNGLSAAPHTTVTLQFAVAINSFLPILVFNDLLRGPEPGSIALVPQVQAIPAAPAALSASLKQLVIEKLAADAEFDLAVRDTKTGFTFFNVEGNEYGYDANAQLLSITGGRLLVSKEFAE